MRNTRARTIFTCIAASAAIAGGLGAAAFAAEVPESEPNGTPATADALNPGTDCFASATASISPAGDIDVFAVPFTAGQRGWLSTDTGGTQNMGANSRDTIMDLIDVDTTTVIENDDDDGTGNGGDGTVETSFASLIAGRALSSTGTGFVQVQSFSASGIVDPYRVFYATSSNPAVPETASNDTAATAMAAPGCKTPVTASIGAAGDADYYSVALTAGQRLFFAADGDPERDGIGPDLVVEVRDPADAVALTLDSSGISSPSFPSAEGGDFVAPIAGTYFVKVTDFASTGPGTYDLLISPDGPAPSTATYSDTVLADTPAGYWRMGEASGTTMLDSAPNPDNGTYLNGVALGQPGAVAGDTAARFDGINDSARVPQAVKLNVGSSFSAEAWVKRTSTTNSQELMNKGANGIQLVVMSAGSGNQVWLRRAGVTIIAHSTVPILADGSYHHIVATMDGPATAKIYVDGVLHSAQDSAVQTIQNTTFPITFGSSASAPSNYDEFALYDGVLTAADVAEHYAAATAPIAI